MRGARRRLQLHPGPELARPARGQRARPLSAASGPGGRLSVAERGEPRRRESRERQLAADERRLRPAPGRRGRRPLQAVLRRRRRRPATQAFCVRRARGARGDARRLRARAGAPGRRQARSRRSRAPAVGGGDRAGGVLRRDARGRPGRSRRDAARSYEALAQMGERGFLSTTAGLLAHALCALGEDDEADRFSRASEDAAAPEDVFSQVLWRSARAKVRARRGDAEAAEAPAREAVGSRSGPISSTHGGRAAGPRGGPRALGPEGRGGVAAKDAAERLERKGNLVSLARARAAVP